MASEEVDVLIVGAGLSGIAAAVHLQKACPDQRFAILEARNALGGTWDLFRYPGVRSDSDMFTLGFSFRPWRRREAIASGAAILTYLRDTAVANGLEERIRYDHTLQAAAWDSRDARWTVQVARGGGQPTTTLRCRFLWMCTGYYRYDAGYRPAFPGEADFAGRIVHPQSWPEDLAWRDQRVVIIGSGATAVSLAPAMAATAAQVTVLQRSPTYVVARPRVDRLANVLRSLLPARLGDWLARAKFVARDAVFYQLATRLPRATAAWLRWRLRRDLGGRADLARDFLPRYAPWQQRLCLVPDGDLYAGLASGKVAYVTDTIDRFTATGVRLASGRELPADLIVTATGLRMALMPDVAITVDGAPVVLHEHLVYKGCLYSGLPNLASTFGYANASWTLKAELVSHYVCRLLTHMQRTGTDWCVPVARDVAATDAPLMALSASYVARAAAQMPRQGSRDPWRMRHNYLRDLLLLRWRRLDDGELHFCRRAPE